ncbi:MAG TPA: MCE family protein [Actinophytocola sp.]|uniref:MCE family protein n=1 Tax=Actinophytocola sp. TaxID=1872138 RepID=UPI002DBD034B|nr:MCE family protein [Actinophytocola sp.]HEU5472387.1 MCE family protein [Actinophytocola sp.]
MNAAERPALRHQVYGLVFLVITGLLVALSIAFYRKTFTPVVPVRLETGHAGNQLRVQADVKLRGVVVGEVRAIRSEGDRAVLDLALDPDLAGRIPANVTARLLPKTLFGERYVALSTPARPDRPIAAGDVISQDRTAASVEIDAVLSDLLPVLQAVRPAELAATLNAMSTALDGRGRQLGETLVALNGYLEALDPARPDLRADIQRLAEVADTYADAAPDLLQALSDLTTTSQTLVAQRVGLQNLLGTLTTAATDLTNFLAANRNNLISLEASARPALEVLAKYAPEYPCLLQQLVDAIPAADAAFGKGSAHPNVSRVTIEITANRGKYRPGVDTPRYDDKRGPRCYPVARPPARFPQYPPGGPLRDGSTKPPPPRSDRPQDFQPTAPAVANLPAERDLVAALVAPSLGVMPEDVPPWATLLIGPLLRGAEVTVE